MRQTIQLPFVAIALVVGAIGGHRAFAPRSSSSRPPNMAAVRMESLFDGLNERAVAKTEIDALEADIRAQAASREAQIKGMEEELQDIIDDARREPLTDEIALKKLNLKFWVEQALAELEVEKALRLRLLYINIKKAIKDLAEAEEYDIIVLDDSIEEPTFERDSRIPAQAQVQQQIITSKILYLESSFDITDDLIMRMNNAFRNVDTGP
ncbi:MAG: OmpH family outer membrane protein [Planctomycetes bacterium]|nr:OmpH family outer membrane protein [Planctomycetota bacterium]